MVVHVVVPAYKKLGQENHKLEANTLTQKKFLKTHKK
jgi:hypothetical protein